MPTFEEEMAAAGFGGQQPQQPTAPTTTPSSFEDEMAAAGFDTGKIDSKMEQLTWPTDGTPRPAYANGLNPEVPINTSPLDITDRLKLSVGNTSGKLNYLKTKFQDARVAKNGKDLLVKNGGLWYQVDPSGSGGGDAWDRTKEIIADTADIAPEIATTATTVGASLLAAAATGGLALPAEAGLMGGVGAAAATARTSLGRLVGTYDATPEDQLKDIAIESLLNVGGTYIAAGVKPTLQMVGKGLTATGKVLQKAPGAGVVTEGVKNLGHAGKKMWGNLTKAGFESIDDLIENPEAVGAVARSIPPRADVDKIIVRNNIKLVDDMVNQAQPTISAVYNKMKNNILKNVEPEFNSEIQGQTALLMHQLADLNLVKVIKPVQKPTVRAVTKALSVPGTDFSVPAAAGTFSAQRGVRTAFEEVSRKEMIEEFSKGSIPKGWHVSARSLDELHSIGRKTGQIFPELLDADVHSLMGQFIDTAKQFRNFKNLRGAKGAAQLLDFNKGLNDLTYRLSQMAEQKGIKAVAPRMANLHNTLDTMSAKLFDTQGLGGAFLDMKAGYNEMQTVASSMLRAQASSRAGMGTQPYETIFNQLISRSGKNETKKYGLEYLVNAAKEHGLANADKLHKAWYQLRWNEAFRKLNPLTRPGLIGETGLVGGIAAGVTGTASPVPFFVAAGITSPRLQYATIQGAFKTKDFIQASGKGLAEAMEKDPTLFLELGRSMVAAPEVVQQVEQRLGVGSQR